MEEVYENLKNNGKNNLNGVIEWMKNAKIIDDKKISEELVKNHFKNTKEAISLEEFKNVMKKLASDTKLNTEKVLPGPSGASTLFDGAFEKLKGDGKNSVDHIIQWMKDTKLVDVTKESEEMARALFSDVKNKKDVTKEKFLDVVNRLMKDNMHRFTEIKEALEAGTSEIASRARGVADLLKLEGAVNTFEAATSAFQSAFEKK